MTNKIIATPPARANALPEPAGGPSEPAQGLSGKKMIIAAVGIMLVAANLRPALVSISPVLGQIRDSVGLKGSTAGLLTTLPLICFGLLSPVAPRLGRRIGIERTVFLALAVLLTGVLLRLVPTTPALFAGTILAGSAIGIVNVLVPALVKRDFAGRAGLMTGLYSMTLSCGASLAGGLTVPIRDATGGDWRGALAIWAGLTVIAMVFWLPQLRGPQHHPPSSPAGSTTLLRNKTAWAVTIFMGMQSLIFYTAAAWLPEYFAARGFSEVAAGGLLALFSIVGMTCSLLAPIVAMRLPDQRFLAVGVSLMCGVGLLGLVLVPSLAVLWVCLAGVGPGAGISLALLMMVLRAGHPQQTSALSGMAQSIGYLLAAIGPFLIGALHDLTSSWPLALGVLTIFVVPQSVAGYFAGRNTLLDDRPSTTIRATSRVR